MLKPPQLNHTNFCLFLRMSSQNLPMVIAESCHQYFIFVNTDELFYLRNRTADSGKSSEGGICLIVNR